MEYWVFGVTRIIKVFVIWRERRCISTTYIQYSICFLFFFSVEQVQSSLQGKKKKKYFFKVFLRILGGTPNQNPSAGDFPEAVYTLHHISRFCYVRGILLPEGLTHNLQATRIIKNQHLDVFQLFLTLHDPF